MDMKKKVEKYNKWYESIDAMRGLESIPVSELLQMAFSAGVEAAEQSVQADFADRLACGMVQLLGPVLEDLDRVCAATELAKSQVNAAIGKIEGQ